MITKEELFDKFSPIALNIYQEYINKYNNKTIEIIPDNKVFVDMNVLSKYPIHLNLQLPLDEIELNFSHELLHCFQKEEGFPSLFTIDKYYSDIEAILASTVLDLDVNKRLRSYGYHLNNSLCEEKIDKIKKQLLSSKMNKEMQEHIGQKNIFIYMCSCIAFCRINISNSKKVIDIIDFVRKDFHDIYNGQKIIYNAINQYGYNFPKNVRKIFKTLLRELKLSEHIMIS